MTDDGQSVRMSQAEYTEMRISLLAGNPAPWTSPCEVYVDDALKETRNMTDPVVETPAAPAPTGVVADLMADVSTVEADVVASYAKAKAYVEKFGLAFLGLVVGWILGKIF